MPTETFFRLRDEKQEAVVRAAVSEFAKHGYSRAKISDIAKKAKISKGSVFQYFTDKRELFIYCAEWGLNTFIAKFKSMSSIKDMDIFDYYKNNAGRFDVVHKENELALFFQVALSEPGVLLNDAIKRMYEVGNLFTIKLIKNGKRKGTIRKDIADELLLEYINGVLERFKFRWMKLYIVDFKKKITPTRQRAMLKEIDVVLKLLREGMGKK